MSGDKKKSINTDKRKYYKVELPREELDKFKPEIKKDTNNAYQNFRLVMLGFKDYDIRKKS